MKNLNKFMVESFGEKGVQEKYIEQVENGLWIGEDYMFKKYLKKKGGSVLDLGCGTGRTTIPLQKMGLKVIGIDITPEMITNAQKIAKKKNLKIDYRVGDATKLDFKDNSFDYAIFSNQGWSMIPMEKERIKALEEIKRVLKKGGVFIFTAHPRVWKLKHFPLWIGCWLKVKMLKPLGFKVDEVDFGDRFFDESKQGVDYEVKQFIHIPSVNEVKKQVKRVGFEIIEINKELQISKKDVRSHPAVFYVCRKRG